MKRELEDLARQIQQPSRLRYILGLWKPNIWNTQDGGNEAMITYIDMFMYKSVDMICNLARIVMTHLSVYFSEDSLLILQYTGRLTFYSKGPLFIRVNSPKTISWDFSSQQHGITVFIIHAHGRNYIQGQRSGLQLFFIIWKKGQFKTILQLLSTDPPNKQNQLLKNDCTIGK